jgi:hypothetical protein
LEAQQNMPLIANFEANVTSEMLNQRMDELLLIAALHSGIAEGFLAVASEVLTMSNGTSAQKQKEGEALRQGVALSNLPGLRATSAPKPFSSQLQTSCMGEPSFCFCSLILLLRMQEKVPSGELHGPCQ